VIQHKVLTCTRQAHSGNIVTVAVLCRFGWFMSSSVIGAHWNTSHSIVDHWRAL